MNKMTIKYNDENKIKTLSFMVKNDKLFFNKSLLVNYQIVSMIFSEDSCDMRIKSKNNKYRNLRINSIEDIGFNREEIKESSLPIKGLDYTKYQGFNIHKSQKKITSNYFMQLLDEIHVSEERKNIIDNLDKKSSLFKASLSYCNYLEEKGYNEKMSQKDIDNRYCIVMLLFKNKYNLYCYNDINVLYFLKMVNNYDNVSILLLAKYFMTNDNLKHIWENNNIVKRKIDIIAKEIKKSCLKEEDVENIETEMIQRRISKILLKKNKN